MLRNFSYLFQILTTLQNVHKCFVSVLKDDDNTRQGIFFQDKEMSNMYQNYPEVMFSDGTYKLKNNFTCYIFLIEDGNGLGFFFFFLICIQLNYFRMSS